MKIRTDFVTNSSSSSFVCYAIDANKVVDVDKLDEDNADNADYYGASEEISAMLLEKKSFLEAGNPFEDGDMIYCSVFEFLDNKKYANLKMSEIRTTIANEIERVFGKKIKEKDLAIYDEVIYS